MTTMFLRALSPNVRNNRRLAMGEWQEVQRKDVIVGEILRVKHDAYSTDAGVFHNGRLVEVIKVDNGDVYVRTIDKQTPEIHEARHPHYKLERQTK